MVRYVVLLSFTEVGASQIQNTTKRAQMVAQRAAALGVRVESVLWTLGECDVVMMATADDEAAVVAWSAYLTQQGYVRPRLLRAFTEPEFEAILGRLPAAPVDLDV